MAFLTDQSWRILKSWYTGGDREQGFQGCFADRLTTLIPGEEKNLETGTAFVQFCRLFHAPR